MENKHFFQHQTGMFSVKTISAYSMELLPESIIVACVYVCLALSKISLLDQTCNLDRTMLVANAGGLEGCVAEERKSNRALKGPQA